MLELCLQNVQRMMVGHLTNQQLQKLNEVLRYVFFNKKVQQIDTLSENVNVDLDEQVNYLGLFLAAKQVEGCSPRTIRYYRFTLMKALNQIGKTVTQITTDDLRRYLECYQQNETVSKTSLDNVRRILSSLFSWLENEDHIIKSPMRRIKKIKVGKVVRPTLADEDIERLHEATQNIRNRAILALLISSGMRVGELVKLNREDIDLIRRECVVHGKGDKERTVYFDARTKLLISQYLKQRTDCSTALFVQIQRPTSRLGIAGVETLVRLLGKRLGLTKLHPHKFRRTLATMAIDKGMPIEQVQHLLGHQSLDTTLRYAMVAQNNVRVAHQKFLSR